MGYPREEVRVVSLWCVNCTGAIEDRVLGQPADVAHASRGRGTIRRSRLTDPLRHHQPAGVDCMWIDRLSHE